MPKIKDADHFIKRSGSSVLYLTSLFSLIRFLDSGFWVQGSKALDSGLFIFGFGS
jgi:hypothetical protein